MPLTPAERSHHLLVALLVHAGGSLTLPASALDPDAIGTADSAHAIELRRYADGSVRVSVQPRPRDAGDGAGLTYL
ncbi:pRL2-19 [Streptomyces sp. DSM 41029]